MSKIFKMTTPRAPKPRRTERSVASFERPDLTQSPVIDPEMLEGESAVARAERIYQEAYATGHQQGEADALQQFHERVGEAHQALESAAVAVRQAHAQFLDSLEPQLIELAKTVAARILRREVKTDPDLIRRTVRAALENLAERQHAVLHLNPDDITALTERCVSLEEEFGSFERIDVVADDTVPHGGCTIETKTVDIDARLDTQLMRIFQAMEE